MIPNHERFLEAIHDRKKVSVRFYSAPDSGVVDRVCAPLDYGPSPESAAGPHRYWLWDYCGNPGPSALGLVPEQIVELQVLGEGFDPAPLAFPAKPWSTPRDWPAPSPDSGLPVGANPSTAAAAPTPAAPAV